MDNSEAHALLEEMDTIRVKAGLTRMDENSRRDFLKKMGAGAVAAGAAAAGISPGTAQAGIKVNENLKVISNRLEKLGYRMDDIMGAFGKLDPQTREDIITQGKISSAMHDVAIEISNIQLTMHDLVYP